MEVEVFVSSFTFILYFASPFSFLSGQTMSASAIIPVVVYILHDDLRLVS